MIQRYSIKTHASGHVDMVPDEHGEWVRYAEAQPRAVFEEMNEWKGPPEPARWANGKLLHAQEGEE